MKFINGLTICLFSSLLISEVCLSEETAFEKWYSKMAAVDVYRLSPIALYIGRDCRDLKPSGNELSKYLKEIESSAMLLASFVSFKDADTASFETGLKGLKMANDANCRLAESWHEFFAHPSSGKKCLDWVEAYQKLYEEYEIRLTSLMSSNVLSKRDLPLITSPLAHYEMIEFLKTKQCKKK